MRDEAIVDAIHVAALFNMIDRMAGLAEFEVPPYESFLGRAETMLAEGYLMYALPDTRWTRELRKTPSESGLREKSLP